MSLHLEADDGISEHYFANRAMASFPKQSEDSRDFVLQDERKLYPDPEQPVQGLTHGHAPGLGLGGNSNASSMEASYIIDIITERPG